MNTSDPKKRALVDSMRGLVVSCQTQPDDPIHGDGIVVKLAQAAEWGGAAGIRANSPAQIREIKAAVGLPLIGLYKIWSPTTDVFITPTVEAAREVWDAGAEIVALDCTFQLNDEGRRACETLADVREALPEAVIFADVSNYEEARHAVSQGADIVGPTLRGYTPQTSHIEEADYREFARMCRDFREDAYLVMEGHIYTPEDAMKAMYLGAHAVVVGSAITRPHLTTKRFTDLLGGFRSNWREAERSGHPNA
jgi:N-acylglucosamine-6-phosphate 2-epimerase